MRASPSASAEETETERVSFVRGAAWSIVTPVTVGAEFATVSESLAVGPSALPSFGVTSTLTTCPLSPLPGLERSRVSVSEADPEVVFRVTPSTFQTYVSVSVSPLSASTFVAVAVST